MKIFISGPMRGDYNAPKNDVIAAMRARGFEPEDDNDADALALLFAYLDRENNNG